LTGAISSDTRSRSRHVLLVVVASLAFATSSPLAKIAVGLSPLAIAAGRCAVAAIAILLAMPRATVGAVRALRPKHRVALPVAGLLLAAHFALFLGGLASTSLPAAVALVSLEPLSVVLAAWIGFGLRPTRGEAFGVLVASAGAMVVASGAGSGEHRIFGDLLVVGAVVLYGAYVAAARGLRDSMPVMPYAAAVYGIAAVLLAPFALHDVSASPAPPVRSVIAIVLLGLIPTLVGHTLVQSAARKVSPAIVALVSPGETIGSLAIGAIALAALPSPLEAAGTALIVAGATIAILTSRG
jgi:drug/metabolite transporter (DMT)-like permease